MLATGTQLRKAERVTSSHHHDPPAPPAPRRVRAALIAALLPLAVLTVVGAVALWPEHRSHPTPATLGAPAQLVDGTVSSLDVGACPNDPSENRCQRAAVQLTSGPDARTSTELLLPVGPGQPVLHRGDHLVLGRSSDPSGTTYYFADFQRGMALAWMGIAFAVLVVAVGRWRGIGALVGLGVTGAVVTQFVLPAVLDGKPPVAVALVGSAAIVLVALYVAHGPNVRTTTALLGTLAGLCATGGLAIAAVHLAHLSGLSSEEATFVQTFAGNVNLQGLLLGGIIIGSLGVLNDVTVTQASAVWEIHRAEPARSRRSLYLAGMRVGRDHIASTVYTLALAYIGAAMPLLILFSIANRRLTDVVTSDVVAQEVVRTLAGGTGLLLAVPLTTGIAALVAKSAGPIAATSPSPASLEGGADEGARSADVLGAPLAGALSIGHGVAPPTNEHEAGAVLEELDPEPEDDEDEVGDGESHRRTGHRQDARPSTTDEVDAIPSEETLDEDEVAEAHPGAMAPRRRWLRRSPKPAPSFAETRRMSRRERKFWSE